MALSKPDDNPFKFPAVPDQFYQRQERLRKEELFMCMALLMEYSPWTRGSLLKMGVVMATRDNRIAIAIECARENDLHPIQYILAKYGQQSQRCDLFVSRPPCSKCAVIIAQAGIRKIYQWPFEPEISTDTTNVEQLFQHYSIGVSTMVPIKPLSLDKKTKRQESYPTATPTDDQPASSSDLPTWLQELKIWEAHREDDPKRYDKLGAELEYLKPWLQLVTEVQVGDDMDLKMPGNHTLDKTDNKLYDLALHSSRMANLISTRSDLPKSSRGAVLQTYDENANQYEIASIGWNGYPMEAEYADYPRDAILEGKDPYIIHAAYNALQYRNTVKLNRSKLYVTEKPCEDCYQVMEKMKIDEVFFPRFDNDSPGTSKTKIKEFCFVKNEI